MTDGSSSLPVGPAPGPGSGPGSGAGSALLRTDLALPNPRRGKVRDVYDLPTIIGATPGNPPVLLVVATDRISAFDVVMPTPVPGKGRLLTAMAAFWMGFVERAGLSRTHLLSTDAGLVPEGAFAGARTTREDLRGRVMIARRCRVVPVECVVRGYLEGSGWAEYQRTGAVCGVALPPGLERCGRLPTPIFTPATKEEQGRHDENISFERACALVGEGLMRTLRERSLAIYSAAAAHALARGIIIADTKFEFGLEVDGRGTPTSTDPILIDEALTPDSSRFWPADEWRPGRPQRSFDKQYLREYLETLVARGAWDKSAPGPELPAEVVRATLERYEDARRRLTA